jgi:hypothetical protein
VSDHGWAGVGARAGRADLFFARLEESAGWDSPGLGRLEQEIQGADLDEADREALLGRASQYLADLDRARGA